MGTRSAIFGTPKMAVFAILGVSKMALRVPESKFRDHFSIQTSPQNPQKATSGTKIDPQKGIFVHFAFFLLKFWSPFPGYTGHFFSNSFEIHSYENCNFANNVTLH